MFIDINSYIGHWPFRQLEFNTLEGLDTLAQENGITHMVVSNIEGFFFKDTNEANLKLLRELENYNGKTKFLPLAIVNPTYVAWEQDARDMIEKGFVGLEIAPRYHFYKFTPEYPFDGDAPINYGALVLDLAEELDVPVRICATIENYRARSQYENYSDPSGDEITALLSTNPNTHVFVTSFSPMAVAGKLGELVKTRKNTYFDFTQGGVLLPNANKTITEHVGKDQLCYGSLSPFQYMETTLVRLEFAEHFDNDVIKVAPARAFKSLR